MMRKQMLVVVVILVVVFGAIFGGKLYANHRAAVAASQQSYPPAMVATAVARDAPWSPQVHVVGSLKAVAGTEISAQIAGNVVAVAFRSGAPVRKGDVLVRLDDSSQLAQLHADQARLQLAQATLARTQKLYAAHAASQSDLQTAEANGGAARAAVEGDRAMLRKLAIAAPFSGVVGIRAVSLGQYVSPGTAVVNLQSYDPLFLDFSLPQSSVSAIAVGQDVAFTVNAYADKSFAGRVTAVGARVDPATRNIAVQATPANPHGLLRPGMYGDVELAVGTAQHGVVVPNNAITYNTFGDNVYVVTTDAQQQWIAHERVVQVRDQRDGSALIASGVQAGDTVVTAGQNKLHDGAAVAVNNSVQP
jgi:membrane fusion protein (multidrug efflux system)